MCSILFIVLAVHVTRQQFILIVDVHNVDVINSGNGNSNKGPESITNTRALAQAIDTKAPDMSKYSQDRFKLLMSTVEVLRQFNTTFDGNYTKDDYKGKTCNVYLNEGKMERVVANNIWAEMNTYYEDDVTLVTQFTIEKTTALNLLLGHWNGPISATLYVGESELDNIPIMFKGFPKVLTRENLDIHIVLKNGVSKYIKYFHYHAIFPESNELLNVFRNIYSMIHYSYIFATKFVLSF